MNKLFYSPIGLFVLSILLILYARTISEGWAGLGWVIMGVIAILAALISLIIVFIMRFLEKKKKIRLVSSWLWIIPLIIFSLLLAISIIKLLI